MQETKSSLKRLEADPTYVMHLTIPEFWLAEARSVPNNLPSPEFDDTGFLGREQDRREVLKHLASAYPVVTVVGEGGIGKTALALRCLYDLSDVTDPPSFDAIVWVTLKTRVLTHTGVASIDDAIRSVLQLFRSVATELGVPEGVGGDVEQVIGEIVDYLSEFRILLAIDNLETVSQSDLRPLLARIPTGSKVLLTSRIGLGEMEIRYPLAPLDDKTAVKLMRAHARSLNFEALQRLPDAKLTSYSKSLYRNPLMIKWFVAAVAQGSEPDQLLRGTRASFLEAIRFCFENLFSLLNASERLLLHVLAVARRPLSRAEIYHLIPPESREALDWSLHTLHNSSMLRRSFEASPRYSLTDIAAEYLSRVAPPDQMLYTRIQGALQALGRLEQQEAVSVAAYRYDAFAIHDIRENRIAATYLRRALNALRERNYKAALAPLREAKALAPGYSEVYRIAGMVETQQGNLFAGEQSLREATEVNPASVIAHHSLAYFLSQHTHNYAEALRSIDMALKIEPGEPSLLTVRAMCLTRLGQVVEGAKIYEQLLSSLADRPRKWRLSTYDQAVECYRRWMEQDLRMRDAGSFRKHVSRALEILESAFRARDFDDKTIARFWRVAADAMTQAVTASDRLTSQLILDALRKHGAEMRMTVPNDVSRRFGDFKAFVGAESLDAWMNAGAISSEEVARGTVVEFNEKHQSGVIRDAQGNLWTFSSASMLSPEQWLAMGIGISVRFIPVRSSPGASKAVQVVGATS